MSKLASTTSLTPAKSTCYMEEDDASLASQAAVGSRSSQWHKVGPRTYSKPPFMFHIQAL